MLKPQKRNHLKINEYIVCYIDKLNLRVKMTYQFYENQEPEQLQSLSKSEIINKYMQLQEAFETLEEDFTLQNLPDC